MQPNQPNHKAEGSELYKLDWDFYKSDIQFVKYFEVESADDPNGQLLYDGIRTFVHYKIYDSLSFNFFFSGEMGYDDKALVNCKQRSQSMEFTFSSGQMNPQISLPLSSSGLKKPTFDFTYYGHHIRVLPCRHGGYFNKNLSLEARLMFPHALQFSDSKAEEKKDYAVLWTHTFGDGSDPISFFSIQKQLLQRLPLSPPSFPVATASSTKSHHHDPSLLTKLDLEYPELLLCFFTLVQSYYPFYRRRRSIVINSIFALGFIGFLFLLYVYRDYIFTGSRRSIITRIKTRRRY